MDPNRMHPTESIQLLKMEGARFSSLFAVTRLTDVAALLLAIHFRAMPALHTRERGIFKKSLIM